MALKKNLKRFNLLILIVVLYYCIQYWIEKPSIERMVPVLSAFDDISLKDVQISSIQLELGNIIFRKYPYWVKKSIHENEIIRFVLLITAYIHIQSKY